MKKNLILMATFAIIAGSSVVYALNSSSSSACTKQCSTTENCCGSGTCEEACSCGTECVGTECECGCACCE